ncbi:hypothetical protein GJAV_G00004720, partial [Gymnothorax javanicus]
MAHFPLCLLILGICMVSAAHMPASPRVRRYVGEDSHLPDLRDPSHIYATNTWWRYANRSAHSVNCTECYVCTHLPASISTPRVELIQVAAPTMSVDCTIKCAMAVSTARSGLISMDPSLPPLNIVMNFGLKLCTDKDGYLKLGNMSSNVPLMVVHYSSGLKFWQCVRGNGTVSVGVTQGCQGKLLIFCGYPQITETSFLTGREDSPNGTLCHPWAPHWNGTRAVDGWYWLCGHRIYVALPPHCGGVCAFVQFNDHTYIVRADRNITRWRRDAAAPHDPIWGTNVPAEAKLWSVGDKIALSLFPHLGVGKVMLRMETVNYRLSALINE